MFQVQAATPVTHFMPTEIAFNCKISMFATCEFCQDDWFWQHEATTSRGYTSLLVPGHDPPKDLTIFMDIALNPGPNSSGNLVNAPPVLDDQHGDFDPVTAFNLPSKGLKIMHLNVRSIGNKLELIKILLLKRSIDILALTDDPQMVNNRS